MNLGLDEVRGVEIEPVEGTCAYYFKLFWNDEEFRSIVESYVYATEETNFECPEWATAFSLLEEFVVGFFAKKKRFSEDAAIRMRDFIVTHNMRLIDIMIGLDYVHTQRRLIARRAGDLWP